MGAGTGAERDDCLMQPSADRYVTRVQERILDAWELPEDGMANREVVLEIVFSADGSLSRAVIRSSSDSRLKQSVARALVNGSPYPPLPAGAECLIGLPIRTVFRNPAD